MGIFNKKIKQEENLIVDDWMRHDYILVDNNISPKDLKPYQRLIVLRKPTGEQKCVVDVSLPYEELKKLQDEVNAKGYANILDDEITRIIPSEYEYSKYYEHKITEETANNISSMFSSTSDKEFDEINEQNLPLDTPQASIISLKDDSINITLVDKSAHDYDPDVDNIDNVKIIIPSEDRNSDWENIEEIFDGSVNNKLNDDDLVNSGVQPSSEEVYFDEVNLTNDSIDENNNEDNDENILLESDNNTKEYDDNIHETSLNPETDYVDYNDDAQSITIENKEPEQVYSFFKNKVALRQYEEQKNNSQRNYYSFYKVPESSGSPIKKVILNKKINMFTYRRKIDKKLLDAKSSNK